MASVPLPELTILGVCGLVVLVGAASRPTPTVSPRPAVETASLPGPLPAGAAARTFGELPDDGERAEGCHFADRGFGAYREWSRLAVDAPTGKTLIVRALIPRAGAVDSAGSFRLLIHFHGGEPVRRLLAPEGLDLVIATLDAGIGSKAYDQAFSDTKIFDRIVAAAEREVARQEGLQEAHARRVVVSSWSAGYGAVGHILGTRPAAVSAIILLDSLYASYVEGHTVDPARVAPFLDAARGAMAGGPPFFLSHTEIATPGYASTGEVATYLLEKLQIKAQPVETPPLRRVAETGHLWIRGYAGADRSAHCQELRRLPAVLREIVLPQVP